MICCAANQPDCRHLEKHKEYWACKVLGCMPIEPQMDECLRYETPGEHDLKVALQKVIDDIDKKFKEYDEWRDHYIRRSIYAGIVILVAYAAWVVWMFTP